jgi:hypothetical protein
MSKTEIKKITWNDKSFQANGKIYHLSTSMSIGRAVFCEEAKIQLETGVRVGQTTEQFQEIYNLLNQGKMADASVKAYNHLKALDSFFERPAPVLRICACFINTQEEDIRYIDDTQVKEKIQDWAEEGISMESFFLLDLIFITEETVDLRNFTLHTSDLAKKYAAKLGKSELNIPITGSPK